MTNETLKKIANEYGTPSYVFDFEEVRNRAGAIKRILNSEATSPIRLCFSIKANPFLIPALIDTVDYFEVCSPGELSICKDYHVPSGKIIYSGVHKEIEDIREAICYEPDYKGGYLPVALITAESLRHYEMIKQVASSEQVPVKLLLRLSSKSQFGMSMEDIETIICSASSEHWLEITGLHYFAGTQRAKLKHQKEELLELKESFSMLREKYAIPLSHFEYGPGLPYPYFFGDDFSDTLAPVKELAPALWEVSAYSELTIEMGRFIASSCGTYLTSVCDLKSSYDHNWCILDGGINHVNFIGQMMGLKCPKCRILKTDGSAVDIDFENPSKKWTMCGSLCSTNDVLIRDFPGGELNIGDVLAIENIGAYSVTEGIYLFLSRDMPSIIVHDKDTVSLVREVKHTWKLNL